MHYVLERRRCSCCRRLNTPAPPFGQAGAVVYGPDLNTAAILLGWQGNVPVEATAALMDALLDAPVSTGFVARAQQRLAEILDGAGFDAAMIAALRAEDVLGADESPVNVVDNIDPDGQPATGSPHVVTVRTPDQRLVWYQAITSITSRAAQKIKDLGIFDRWHGVLVRDDYAGYHQFDDQLAGVQQCAAHVLRHLQGVAELDADNQLWATQVATALRDAAALVAKATTSGDPVEAEALADARRRYDQGVKVGISFNLSRPWPKGQPPRPEAGPPNYRPRPTRYGCSPTTCGSRGPTTPPSRRSVARNDTRTAPATGRPPLTLSAYCRVRSYLVTAANHGIHAIDAIHTALAGKPWPPTPLPPDPTRCPHP